jgi:hypothetical protein
MHNYVVLRAYLCYTFKNIVNVCDLLLVNLFFMENNAMQPGSENQNPNQFPSFQGGQQEQGPSVPPPPSSDQQIGVRTMESDIESVRQSGGEQPQSRVVNAGEVFGSAQQESFQPSFQSVEDVNSVPVMPQSQPQEPKQPSSFSFKTILVILGIIVVAVGVGFGVFYLVQSLNSTPEITEPVVTETLPTATQTPQVENTSTTPVVEEVLVPPALVHASVLSGVSKNTLITLVMTDTASVRVAIASSSNEEKLVAGTVKDVAFVDANNAPVESITIVQALLPSVSANLSSLIDRDITGWLYGDKSGGNKLGLAIPLREGVTQEQITAAFASLESSPQDVLNMFIPTVQLPASPVFKEGPISGITVRYLAISTKDQQVFEYAPVSVNGKGYLIITSSYNQMVDILKRLDAKVLMVVAPVVPEATTTPTTTTP